MDPVDRIIGKQVEHSVDDPPSSNPQYQAWRKGFEAGRQAGWAECRERVMEHFARLLKG